MRKLREALDDSAENPRFRGHTARRGYRFVAPIEVLATNQAAGAVVAAPAHEAAHPQRSLDRWITGRRNRCDLVVGSSSGPFATMHLSDGGHFQTRGGKPTRKIRASKSKAYAAYLNGVAAMGLQNATDSLERSRTFEEAVKLRSRISPKGTLSLVQSQLQLLFGGRLSPREVVRRLKRPHAGRWSSMRRRLRRIECSVKILILYYWDREQSGAEHQRAAELDAAGPGDLEQPFPRRSVGSGDLAEDVRRAEEARNHDRLAFPAQMSVGAAYRAEGRRDPRDRRSPPCAGDGARAKRAAHFADRRDLCRHGSEWTKEQIPGARSLGFR